MVNDDHLNKFIQGIFEMRAQILITDTRKKYLKNFMSKNKMTFIFLSYNFFKLLLVFYVVLQSRR
jgi:hypothetical protein